MKKFIYTDMDAIKSISAQIYQGNILEHEFGQEESSGNVLENASSKSQEMSSGSNLGVNVPVIKADVIDGLKSTEEEANVTIEEVIRKDNEVIKIALDEFLINKVENKLLEEELLLEINEAEQFDYVVNKSKFEFYDFDLLKKVVSYEKLLPFLNFDAEFNHIEDFENIYEEYKALYKKHIKNKNIDSIKAKMRTDKNNEIKRFLDLNNVNVFKQIEFISDHINSILQNKILLISEDKQLLIFCDKNKLKYSTLALSLNENLDLKVFGQLTTIKTLEAENMIVNKQVLEIDEIMNKPTTFIFETYLTQFLKIGKGTNYKILHPFSIETI